MRYLACNTNSYNHTDYNKPITVHKSTDYRTSTGTSHRHIAPIPQDFDARVQIKPIQIQEPIFKDELYTSEQQRNYIVKKSVKNPLDLQAPSYFFKVHYIRNVEEKLFRNPPPPLKHTASECHEEYYKKPIPDPAIIVRPPNPYHLCAMRAFGRDEQPPMRPEDNGYHKHGDIYLTTNRISYVPYSQLKQDGIARKDIVTYYDGNGIPRGGKGYGPRNDQNIEPLVLRRIKPEPQKSKHNKKVPSRTDTVPHFAYKPEYSDMYRPHTNSDFYPFLFDSGVQYNEVLSNATAWQTMAAPGMYCTEYCHYGTGWPVRSVVELKKPEKAYLHCVSLNCLCNNIKK